MVAAKVGTRFACEVLAWCLHGLTNVCAYVGPFEPTFISRTHATSTTQGTASSKTKW